MSEDRIPAERRRYQRLRVTFKVELSWGKERVTGFGCDLSEGGAFVEAPRLPAIGQHLRVDFKLAAGAEPASVIAEGRVMRCVTPEQARARGVVAGVGIEFDRVLFGKSTLRDYLAARRRSEAKPPRSTIVERAPRLEAELPLRWSALRGASGDGRLVNLSESGAFVVLTEEPVRPGTEIVLSFQLPLHSALRTVNAVATVVRVLPAMGDQPPGMGLAFKRASEDIDVLKRFVEERLPRRDEAEFYLRFQS